MPIEKHSGFYFCRLQEIVSLALKHCYVRIPTRNQGSRNKTIINKNNTKLLKLLVNNQTFMLLITITYIKLLDSFLGVPSVHNQMLSFPGCL